MRALHLDFFHPAPPRVRLGLALLALGLTATAFVLWRHYTLDNEAAAIEARLADSRRLAARELPRLRVPAGDPKLIAQEVGQANTVLARLAFPWDALFGQLESAANDSVALLAIQPEASGSRLRLAGEARRFEDLLAYIGRLEATPGLANVYLAAHEQRANAGRAVAFTVVAEWVGAR